MQAIAQNYSLATDQAQVTSMMGADANFLDPKRDWTTGIWGLPTHTKPSGDRFSARDYIQDTIKAKFPLTLGINSLVTRVLFSNGTSCGGQPRATGVEYLSGKSLYKADARYTDGKGTLKTATARKEVIIAGGTFNTPQILMLSGIGPKEHLAEFKIPVVVDAQGVGRNMQDNQEMPIIGVISGSGGTFSQAFAMHTTKHSPDGERDMFMMQGPGFAFRGFWPSNQTNNALPAEAAGTYGISMVKNHPQNRKGYVKLVSSNPQDMPDINFSKYMDQAELMQSNAITVLYEEGKETDMGAMKDTIAWARKIYSSAKGVKVAAKEPPCPAPDAEGYCGQTDEDWITGQTFGHHPTSTAAIGKDGDAMAVLDSRFRVRGVKGLRVVDASTFPRIPGVFPVVSTFMISEKASDVVKEDADKDVCAA
jgi:choline dehydrogenase